MRVKIFVDFWNFQLAWNTFHGKAPVVKIPWNPRFYDMLVSSIDKTAVYAGTHVFASFDPLSKKDLQLRKFLNVMDSFPGYRVVVKERKPLNHLRCSNDGCRLEISKCPHCGQDIRRTVEKGVDTALVTDLIRFGIDDYYDRRDSRRRRCRPRSGSRISGRSDEASHTCVVQRARKRAS